MAKSVGMGAPVTKAMTKAPRTREAYVAAWAGIFRRTFRERFASGKEFASRVEGLYFAQHGALFPFEGNMTSTTFILHAIRAMYVAPRRGEEWRRGESAKEWGALMAEALVDAIEAHSGFEAKVNRVMEYTTGEQVLKGWGTMR